VPLEVKILGIAPTSDIFYEENGQDPLIRFRTTPCRIKKFEEKLPISTEKKQRNLVAIDETVVKANGKRYYVFAAMDVERNELILMRVYTARNHLTAKSFVKEVLNYCEGKPKFVVDKAPWLKSALESFGLEYEHETFREEKQG